METAVRLFGSRITTIVDLSGVDQPQLVLAALNQMERFITYIREGESLGYATKEKLTRALADIALENPFFKFGGVIDALKTNLFSKPKIVFGEPDVHRFVMYVCDALRRLGAADVPSFHPSTLHLKPWQAEVPRIESCYCRWRRENLMEQLKKAALAPNVFPLFGLD